MNGATGKRYASSTDVARLAGVSQSAVSRTFKPGASVSHATRSKVLEAAAALGYRPSAIPRIMLTERSNLVALVTGGMDNPFYATVLERFTVRLQETGHQVLLVHADSGHMLDGAIPRLASYRVDAIVSALAILSPQAAAELSRLRIPVISFNTPIHNEWISAICCDNEAAGRAVADLFVARGARRCGFVAGPADSPASAERRQGFCARLAERGLPSPAQASGGFRYEGGFEAGLALLDAQHPPDAIFCANDLMALGVMDAARIRCGLRVPEDLMVAGFDGIPAADWAGYALTTCVQDAAVMIDQAVAILQRGLAADRAEGQEVIIVPAHLIERASTARATPALAGPGHAGTARPRPVRRRA
ncbi:MAG TPA: LacI family DNA-binding transcriptional regulator [Acetobacteraceae bacterium]|nr:LacI family DNA-binding transcriptional regulator [Acetobacteraceae bacterium]